MYLLFVSFFTLSFAMSLGFCFTPVMMGVWVLMISFGAAGTTSVFISSWFGLILFIIYAGGMLVMFSYFSAISPNQKFFGWVVWASVVTSFAGWVGVFGVMEVSFDPVWYVGSTIKVSQVVGSYGFGSVSILIILGFSLFLALVVVVKIVSHSKGALRSFM